MKILSIQSAVAYGHVGNSAAVFPLQRIGVEVLPVYTVNFSNHTGYGAWRGPLIAPDDVRDVILGIEERGVLPEIDVVLSGYQGSEGIADVILDAVARVKSANPSAVYACDPVMGNAASGCFVAPAIPVLLRERVVPAADIITPNQFELGFLTGTEPADLASTLDAVDAARAIGPSTVLVTSVERPDRPALEDGTDTIEMLAATDDGAWVVQTPRIPMKANGSGDVTAALFTAHYRESGDAAAALARTTSSVW
ncbi:MAG: pyridoxal kinase PdxY, partial [Microbacterium sp.]|nr:pyridoxal kinase PdxY [Microbacterium sp.]